MAPQFEAGYTPNLASFLHYIKEKENNSIESCIDALVSSVPPWLNARYTIVCDVKRT